MAGKADIRRRVQVGDKLVVIKYDTPFPSKVKVGDIRTVRSVTARLITWDGILDGREVTMARTELGADTVVTWKADNVFQVAYDEGPTVLLQIVPSHHPHWRVKGEAHGEQFDSWGFHTQEEAEAYASQVIDGDIDSTIEVLAP